MDDQSETPTSHDLPDLPTFGGSGTMPGIDLADGVGLRDLLDEGETLDTLR